MNSYLIEGSDSLSVKNERDKIISDNGFQEAPINSYDMEEVGLDAALEDLDTYGLFSDKKVIIIENIEVLKQEENKDYFDHLFRYVASPNPDNLLIIEAKKLNNTLKVTKELKKACQSVTIEVNPRKFLQEAFQGYKVENTALSLLEEYCLDDFTKMKNECDKLKSYKADEKVITKDDVLEMVVKKLGDSKDLTFAFSRCLALRDRKEALEKYQELLQYDIEPISLIGLLASQMRIIYQVKLLEKDHLSDKAIASTLGEKSDYRITKTRELTRLYSEEDLLKIMQELAKMDMLLKTEDVDGNHLIEMFILNI